MATNTILIIIAIVAVGLIIWYLLSGGEQGPAEGPTSSKPDQGPTSKPGEGPLGSNESPNKGPSGDKPPQGPSTGVSE